MQFLHRWVLAVALSLCSVGAFAVTGTLTDNGDTSAVNLTRPHIHLSEDFGGGTVTCYLDDGGGTYVAIDDAVFTSAADVTIELERAAPVKCTLSGATSPTLKWIIR